jgi:hypothetical protein
LGAPRVGGGYHILGIIVLAAGDNRGVLRGLVVLNDRIVSALVAIINVAG